MSDFWKYSIVFIGLVLIGSGMYGLYGGFGAVELLSIPCAIAGAVSLICGAIILDVMITLRKPNK